MLTQAFVDESGGKGQGRWMVFSSWLGEAERWAAFSDDWAGWLAASPRLGYFKFAEAAKIGGQFHGFTIGQRDDKVLGLVDILKRHAFTEQFQLLDLGAFGESSFGVNQQRPTRDPYFMPFQLVTISVAHEVRHRGYTEPCEIIFDEQVIFGPRAREWYPIIRAAMTPDVRALMPVEPLFRSDLSALPLQAADLTAGLRMRTLTNQNDSFDARLWKALEGFVNVSQFSAVIDSNLLREADLPLQSAEEARSAWSAMEAYLDKFGGDPIQAFEFWVNSVRHLRKPE